MSKSTFNSVVSANIPDNNNKFVTPARHRTVLASLRDFVGWLAEINVWTALNTFSAGTLRPSFHITGTGTVTISTLVNDLIINSGVTQANLTATPQDGQWHDIKNASGGTVVLSGNGKNIYTSSANATRNIINGGSYKVYYDAADDVWYNK